MRRFFYFYIFQRIKQDVLSLTLSVFSAGVLVGCLVCGFFYTTEFEQLCIGLLLDHPSAVAQIIPGLFPLLFAGGLAYLFSGRLALILSSGLSGFLLSFSITALVLGLPRVGWLTAALLLAGRSVALVFLFWFLLRRANLGRSCLGIDLLVAGGLSALCLIFFSWLLSPALEEIGLFIST